MAHAIIGWHGSNFLPNFGLWGGDGYSAGVVTEVITPAMAESGVMLITVDGVRRESPVDLLFKTHDLAYRDAEGLPNEAVLILAADIVLMNAIATLSWDSLSGEETAYAAVAAAIFVAKILSVDPAMISIKEIQAEAVALWEQIQSLAGVTDKSFANLVADVFYFNAPAQVGTQVSTDFSSAQAFIPRRDPLTLDLDGDGLETVGIDLANPILFDHDGDGIKNATGWIRPDDGFLVLDRNGDGFINNGTELFGDSTPLYGDTLDAQGNPVVTGLAADGFAALAAQDTNGDGVVNNLDANWNELRIWQDANSDGISQAGELKTLDSLGIVGITVAKTENTTILANGNQIADLGTFIRADGTDGTLGNVTGNLADIDLADNTFIRSFGDVIPSTPATINLPNMQGSGMVRDLRQAANDAVFEMRNVA